MKEGVASPAMGGCRPCPQRVARYPEIRRELFYNRILLARRDALFCSALVSLAIARRHPVAGLALALPYARFIAVGGPDGTLSDLRWHPKGDVQGIVYDVARVTGLLRGGLRNGRIIV